MNDPEAKDESFNTPIVSPFLDSDENSDDGEVLSVDALVFDFTVIFDEKKLGILREVSSIMILGDDLT
ncbi:hypothetical protein Tco_1467908 [Tanacetum coccineum]